jgi:AraC family transcriptional regulator, exoenzyme S synthesis regulatory protein ExsA
MPYIKAPSALTGPPFNQRELKLNGFSVVESCSHFVNNKGSMFLEDHMLLFVKQGTNRLKDVKTTYLVKKNEMVLLKKSTVIDYDKNGDPENNNLYISLMFFLKNEFIKDFVKIAVISADHAHEPSRVLVMPVQERLLRFFESIEPYFNEPEKIDNGLVRIKMLELLYDLASIDNNLLRQLLQMDRPVRSDLSEVMEQNYTKPVSIKELAYLSGRSLAAFKRDFQSVYNMPPAEWIKIKRLERAKEILENSFLPVADVCYTIGFENTAHFSRIFKEHFGITPSSLRKASA